jgi:hypothetical protein
MSAQEWVVDDEGLWSGPNVWAQRPTGPAQIAVSIGPGREKRIGRNIFKGEMNSNFSCSF